MWCNLSTPSSVAVVEDPCCEATGRRGIEGVGRFELIGLEVIRFTNLDVDNNFDGVCGEIIQTVNTKLGTDIYQ